MDLLIYSLSILGRRIAFKFPWFSNPRRDTVFIQERFSLNAKTQPQILSDKSHWKFCVRVKNKLVSAWVKVQNFQNPEL